MKMLTNLTFKSQFAYIWKNLLFKGNVLEFLEQLSSNILEFGATFEKIFKKFRTTVWEISSNVLNFLGQLSSNFLDFGASFEERFKRFRATCGTEALASGSYLNCSIN